MTKLKKTNIPPEVSAAAAALGRRNKGVKKNITKNDSLRRSATLAENRYRGGRKKGSLNKKLSKARLISEIVTS